MSLRRDEVRRRQSPCDQSSVRSDNTIMLRRDEIDSRVDYGLLSVEELSVVCAARRLSHQCPRSEDAGFLTTEDRL
jgi:hypothetical protein